MEKRTVLVPFLDLTCGPAGDLIALGSKDPKSGVASRKAPGASSVGALPVKRESPAVVGLNKKPKLSSTSSQQFTALGRTADVRTASPTTHVYLYEELAKDVEPRSFVSSVLTAAAESSSSSDNNDDTLDALLCGAVKYLKTNRARPEPPMFVGLMYLAKARPAFFVVSDTVTEAMCSLLRRDVGISFKSKGNPLVSVLVCNVLAAAFQEEENWPDTFVKVYIEDSLGERIWVDRTDCKVFTENIQTAFGTKLPSTSQLQDKTPSASGGSPLHFAAEDDDDRSQDALMAIRAPVDEDIAALVQPRYSYQRASIEADVLGTVREQLSRRGSVVDSGLRNLLRLLTVTAAYPEVRQLAAQRLEMWLQNPKLSKVSQDLLLSVCMNCDQHSTTDVEVMSQICKIRLKMKNLIAHYFLGIRQLLSQHPSNLSTMMSHTIYNELSNSRNPNNMALLGVMFSHDPVHAAKHLAEVFHELLLSKDDYLRALRALLREIVRAVRQDMNFPELALGLMKERTDTKFKELDQVLKDRLLFSLADMIALTALLSISPAVKEAASAVSRGDHKDVDILRAFQKNIAIIQRDAVWWLHTVVPAMYEPSAKEYVFCLRKLLFVEAEEFYYKLDNWPPEGERGLLLGVLIVSMPVLEDTLMRVLVIGLSRDLHLTAADALEIAEQLVRRAASTQAGPDFPVLKMERGELFDVLFKLCTYKHPENIALPKGYTPPALAISNLYWKAWLILLIITAYNPSVFGKEAWNKYPTLRCLMEMTMANNYKFPPPTMATEERRVEEIVSKEKQLSEVERQEILTFEGYLAAATRKVQITQANSLLIAQLTSMNPRGVARRPPNQVLEQLKWLKSSLSVGQMLCRSREPDFLLDIIHSQGPSESMPWLAELVESSEGSLDVLPVQCLCEFLLHDVPTDSTGVAGGKDDPEDTLTGKGGKKHEQLVWRLQGVLHSPDSDPRTIQEVLDYFLQRLTSTQSAARQLAVKGLSLVLGCDDEEMEDDTVAIPSHRWLLKDLPAIPQFECVKEQACLVLRRACQLETDAPSVAAYIVFLATHTEHVALKQLDELALDMAQLIVERATLLNHLLPVPAPAPVSSSRAADTRKSAPHTHAVLSAMLSMFHNYLLKAQEPQKEAYSWSNTQDQILIQWESGESATMNILVVHAMVILLTYGEPAVPSPFGALMSAWFPAEGEGTTPTAYLVDTSEEALLLPDWLKLRMIRCHNQPLVLAALQDLEPAQLLLFVQSFGIPIWSMSQLLHHLDRAVDMDSEAMEEGVVDKGYMAQLVEVQHMRGATGGEKFKAMLSDADTSIEMKEPEDDLLSLPKAPLHTWQLERTPSLPSWEKQLTPLLLSIFLDDKLTHTDRLKTFRSLHKSLMTTPPHVTSVLTSLTSLLTGTTSSTFVAGLLKHATLAQPMLRAIMAKADSSKMDEVLQHLHNLLKGNKSPLAAMVNTALNKHSTPLPQQQYTDIKQALSSCEVARTERAVTSTVMEQVKKGQTKEAVTQVCQLLAAEQPSKTESSSLSVIGPLVDWLKLLDPELIQENPDAALAMLFSEGGGGGGAAAGCQRHLLALLTHQTNWRTLHRCIQALLDQDRTSLSASLALDFLYAVLHVPKVWQGRDKKKGKRQPQEHVLQLTPKQITRLVRLILLEAHQQKTAPSEKTQTAKSEKVLVSDERASLLLTCCRFSSELSRTAIGCLTEACLSRTSGGGGGAAGDTRVALALLQRLYMVFPYHQTHNISLTPEPSATTQLDLDTHHMLLALDGAGPSKKAEHSMFDANIACRKLASEHPTLLLRQLPMMASILQGRCQYAFGEVKHRNHLLLFTHVLGILELLTPTLFQPRYTAPLRQILDAFFQLIELHGLETKQLASIINKFVQFIHQFVSQDGGRASRMLQPHVQVLEALTCQYPDLALLRSLLAAVSVPLQAEDSSREKKEGEGTQEEADSVGTDSSVMTTGGGRPVSPWNLGQLTPFINKIAAGSATDDVLDVLKDLDETSKRKVDILQHFLSDLKRLTSAENENCRNTAHSLIMRHIRHDPSCSGEFVRVYSHCLESSNQAVVISALKQLPELVLLAQEHAESLLSTAFRVGAVTKIDTETYICEAVQLLNMDTLLTT